MGDALRDGPTIAIDLGHGGKSRGAVVGDIEEVTLNQLLGFALADKFEYSAPRINAVLLQTGDITMEPAERRQRALDCGAVAGISIHHNFNQFNSDLAGSECYVWPGIESRRTVAEAIINATPAAFKATSKKRLFEATNDPDPDDDWLQRPRGVLSWFAQPWLVYEAGYLSNARDREMLLHPNTVDELAVPLQAGVLEMVRIFGD